VSGAITRLESRGLRSPHGFLGRTGGVSQGIFASLNVGLGSSDLPDAVRENRARSVASVMPGAQLVTLHQVHSALAVEAGDWPDAARPHADGVVTDRPGLLLGILTADCAPLLLEDADAAVIGACHAGWKGALGGVIGATVDAMEKLGARRERIAAAVGPCIGRRSYEVDEGFRARFEAEDADTAGFFTDGRPGHAWFDLEGYCLKRLAGAGVARAEGLGADTKTDAERFFSYRRKTLAGEPDYGRQLSLIGLPG
jgi:polyphenol oxidase